MPQEAPRRSQEADSYVFYRAGEAPGRGGYVFFTCQRGPSRAQEADPYRKPEDAPGWPPETCLYVFSLRVAEPPFSLYVFRVSAVVATSFAAVSRHGYFSHSGGLLAGSYVKTRAASDGAEMTSV